MAVLSALAVPGLATQTQTQQQPPVSSSPLLILPPQMPQPAKDPAVGDGKPGTPAGAAANPAPPTTSKAPAAVPPTSVAPTPPGAKAPPKKTKGPTVAPSKDAVATGQAYVIGAEDVLYIRVWQNPELSGQVRVGPDGMISLQLIDEVKASGFTPHQLEEELVKRFTKFIIEPEVNVQVLGVNSRMYIIQGDGVNRPGIFPLTRPMTVQEALIAGAGFSPFAHKNKIYVLRGTQRFKFNWNEVSKGKHMEQNILIQSGDQIYVP